MTDRLHNRVALVTGGASGIGRATALVLARAGARVVVADVHTEGGEETCQLIHRLGGEAQFIRADVARADQVEALVSQTVAAYGRLDCAHNNAGIEGRKALTADSAEDDWDAVLAVNLKGVWLCMKYELQQMLRQGSGAIVNTASVAGLVGFRQMGAYTASKHGILGLTKTAALEYATHHIRVNAVCPGVIRTPMIERSVRGDPQIEAQYIAREPIGRMGTPEEVAEAVVWLCSDAASFVTGHALTVDGALTAS